MVVFGAGSLREWKHRTTLFIFAEDPEAGGRLHRPRRRGLLRRRALHATVRQYCVASPAPPFASTPTAVSTSQPPFSFPSASTRPRTHSARRTLQQQQRAAVPGVFVPVGRCLSSVSSVNRSRTSSTSKASAHPIHTTKQQWPSGCTPCSATLAHGFESRPAHPFFGIYSRALGPGRQRPWWPLGATRAPRGLAPHVSRTGWLCFCKKCQIRNYFRTKSQSGPWAKFKLSEIDRKSVV